MEETKVAQKIDEEEIKRIMAGFFGEYMEGFKDKIKI